jgi:hypothetical protein
MKKLVLITLLFLGALGSTAWSRDHIYCNDNYAPLIGKCHVSHGHSNGH